MKSDTNVIIRNGRFIATHRAVVLLFMLSIFASAQNLNPRIKPGANVYVEPMNGFGAYLVAAITNVNKVRDRIPLVVVTDKDKAEYIITCEVHETAPGEFVAQLGNTCRSRSPAKISFTMARPV